MLSIPSLSVGRPLFGSNNLGVCYLQHAVDIVGEEERGEHLARVRVRVGSTPAGIGSTKKSRRVRLVRVRLRLRG